MQGEEQLETRLNFMKLDSAARQNIRSIKPAIVEALPGAPDVGSGAVEDFVQGVITTDEGVVTLLTLDGVLPRERAAAA